MMNKKILTAAIALSFLPTSLCVTTATAANSDDLFSTHEFIDEASDEVIPKVDNYTKYSFNDYMKMTDEEFISYAGEYTAHGRDPLTQCGFGDSSVDDSEKFEKYLNGEKPSYFHGDHWVTGDYNGWMRYISGEAEPYIAEPYIEVWVDPEIPLDKTVTAAEFGLPDEWKVECVKGRYVAGFELSSVVHEYHVTFPVEVLKDFESFVRLDKAVSECEYYGFAREKYGIIGGDIFGQFLLRGQGVFVPDAELIGDANCDGDVTIADAAAVLQHLGNADQYKLSALGKSNADIDENGLTPADAVAIQKLAAESNSVN